MITPITTTKKALICFVVDMSSSLEEKVLYQNRYRRKCDVISQIVNIAITEHLLCCNRGGEYKEYFDIMVIGYNGSGVVSLLDGLTSNDRIYASVNELVSANYDKCEYSGEVSLGGISTEYKRVAYNFVTISPSGETPMYEALAYTRQEVAKWLSARGESVSQVLITHLTDGNATDSEDEELLEIANRIKQLNGTRGGVILSNIHIGNGGEGGSILFPSSSDGLDSRSNAKLLYEMSSELPHSMCSMLKSAGGIDYDGVTPLRSVSYNASLEKLTAILQVGTLSINQDF